MAAVRAEVGVVSPALWALAEGYDVYAVEDVSACRNSRTNAVAIERLIQAGVIPVTWVQVMWEWQRGHEESELAMAVAEVMNDHGGWVDWVEKGLMKQEQKSSDKGEPTDRRLRHLPSLFQKATERFGEWAKKFVYNPHHRHRLYDSSFITSPKVQDWECNSGPLMTPATVMGGFLKFISKKIITVSVWISV